MWQVHGDVFRPPANSALLSVYVGTGSQLFGMALVTMVFAVLGFLSPANRGGLMTAMLLLFVFMGIFGGYSAGRLYKTFKVLLSIPPPLVCILLCLSFRAH
jgi:transmembrane 9 superfamily protein 2/4